MIHLTAPIPVKITNIRYSPELLQGLPCGLFRAGLGEAYELLPELSELYNTIPVLEHVRDQYEIDVKIHMLMRGQYPCIPNWHCDNVPREDGKLRYDKATTAHPMYIWISGVPRTEFLYSPIEFLGGIKDHSDLQEIMQRRKTFHLSPQTWYEFDQLTPHRGHAAEENCWRVFVRVTPKSIAPSRPVIHKVRRHCQVYLPHDFTW